MNIYGLIGYPLGHSFSKKYFTQKFEEQKLDYCKFELFPLERIELFTAILKDYADLKGLAVTIPYKQTVMPFLDKLSPGAKEIGAVNCISFSHGTLMGYNTDVIGFENSLVPILHAHHKKALVLGSGGAARAVQYVLKKLKIPVLNVSRTTGDGLVTYNDITESTLQEHTIIINTTPLGMSPHEDTAPDIPYNFISKDHLLYDLVYQPPLTLFLQNGQRQGAAIKNGMEMLVLQAEENWRIWNME